MRWIAMLLFFVIASAGCGPTAEEQAAAADAAAAATEDSLMAASVAAFDASVFDTLTWETPEKRAEYGPVVYLRSCAKCHGAEGLGDSFHPSAIEVHPESGSLILLAAREEAIVEVGPQGELVATRELKRKDHPQPEGVAFLQDGTMVLADEGQGKRGTLTRYSRKGTRGGGNR